MPRFPTLLTIFWLTLASGWNPSVASAWNSTGHMIIASMAYDQLTPEARAKWVTLLKQHPDYSKWEQSMPKDVPNFDSGRYLVMRASTWPDEIRRGGSPYDHPVWHYVDYPLETPNFPMEPAPTTTENVLFGLDRCEKTLRDPAATPVDQAAALSWIIHLTGDIQQPLHCAELISAAYPKPDGDRGGNLFFVSVAGNAMNLHSLWDSLPGSLLDTQEIIQRATGLAEKYPRAILPELTQALDPLAWSLEGRALAIDAVYNRGSLPGGREMNAVLPPLPTGYIMSARALASRRVALGGYRLGDTLQRLAQPPQ